MKDDGKKPLLPTWKELQHAQVADETLHKWLERHGRANVAIITGKVSGLTILDCDDPSMAISKLFELFGETPIVVKTPGGGHHLYITDIMVKTILLPKYLI